MYLIDDRLILSASDLVGFLACAHLTQLELAVTRDELVRPERYDPELDLLVRKGGEHEASHLERLRVERGNVVEIPDEGSSLIALHAAENATLQAMRSGAEVIYQAGFFDGRWRGRADFLLRVDAPSDVGDWSYEVADAKLARSVKVAALLQMCEYSRHVTRLQGCAPRLMHVVLGTGHSESHPVAEYEAYYRAARRRFEETVRDRPVTTYPEPVDHCRVCRWQDVCNAKRRSDDHLSLVAGMRRDHTRRLTEAGISTVATLAVAPPAPVDGIGDAPWERLRQQARLQMSERWTGDPTYELLPIAGVGLGLEALPPPSPGDLFFDMEGDPFAADGGLEYLFGISEVVDGAPRYRPFWAHTRAEEKLAFESLVDHVVTRLNADPALHVYHYAGYEANALKTLMGRHATREEEVDRILRAGVLVDLYRVVKQGVRVSRESYSLKSLEAFYMAERADAIASGGDSIVAYERWIETREPEILEDIAAYNARDCESTWRLREWLERLRGELGVQTSSEVPRPEPRSGDPSEALAEVSAETRALVDALTADVPDPPAAGNNEQRARWLLAQLLDWHRREDKSAWWAYYERREMTDDQLVEDAEAIGHITHLGAVRDEKKSVVHRYAFDPTQEHKLDVGDQPRDPRTGGPCGEIVAIDNDEGSVELRRGPSLEGVHHPSSLIPAMPIDTTPMRVALRRVAASVIAGGHDAPGRYRAVRDLLLTAAPRLRGTVEGGPLVRPGDYPVAAACRLVADFDECCLPIQGPPGCGKTHTAAEMIVEMVDRGWRVGVSATTHRAIGELLTHTSEASRRRGVPVRLMQKCDPEKACDVDGVVRAAHNADVEAALLAGEVDVVAGTSWLFADARFDGLLDAIVIDEAGQMSLANVLAVGTAARNLVLVGDPQQLAQPSRGIHPEGADRSALEHLIGDHDTIPADRGIFLDTTWRMHPAVCRFVSLAFYEGRLTAHEHNARQRVDGPGALGGAGTRLVAIPHVGNRTWSPEEVAAVHGLIDDLSTRCWTDAKGITHAIGLSDILVVAPYNAQVRRLRERLPADAQVGTVDRFQGRQAAVTIYSMATSSAEDVPRNLEFLFSRNRLNVAVSRARALSIVVCSAELFRVRCRTPMQMRLVNALCRFAEMAAIIELESLRGFTAVVPGPVRAPAE